MNTPDAVLTPSFMGRESADRLYCRLLADIDWDDQMQSRLTACFGQTYDDSGITYQQRPMHPLLVPVVAQVSRLLGFTPTNCLLNYYPDASSSMGFHSDATYNLDFDTGIAIASLGAERELTFKHKEDATHQVGYSLPHGSLFYMTQETQDHWMHAVKRSTVRGGRISLTFRRILSPFRSNSYFGGRAFMEREPDECAGLVC